MCRKVVGRWVSDASALPTSEEVTESGAKGSGSRTLRGWGMVELPGMWGQQRLPAYGLCHFFRRAATSRPSSPLPHTSSDHSLQLH